MAWTIDTFVEGFAAYGEAMHGCRLRDDLARDDAAQIRPAPTYLRDLDAVME